MFRKFVFSAMSSIGISIFYKKNCRTKYGVSTKDKSISLVRTKKSYSNSCKTDQVQFQSRATLWFSLCVDDISFVVLD